MPVFTGRSDALGRAERAGFELAVQNVNTFDYGQVPACPAGTQVFGDTGGYPESEPSERMTRSPFHQQWSGTMGSVKRNSREGFHASWDRIIGPEAADFRYQAYRAQVRLFQSAVVSFIFTIVSGVSKHTHWAHVLFLGLAYGAIGIGFIWLAVWIRRRSQQYRPASEFLKTTINAQIFPPSDEHAFAAWCRRHGVTPPH